MLEAFPVGCEISWFGPLCDDDYEFLGVPDPAPTSGESDGADGGQQQDEWNTCPCCGGRMVIVETFEPGCQPRFWSVPSIGLDSS